VSFRAIAVSLTGFSQRLLVGHETGTLPITRARALLTRCAHCRGLCDAFGSCSAHADGFAIDRRTSVVQRATLAALTWQVACGQSGSLGATEHAPVVPGRLQAAHNSLQGESQHTPSTQLPLLHSLPSWHAAPNAPATLSLSPPVSAMSPDTPLSGRAGPLPVEAPVADASGRFCAT
jgi:hypothetical protein